ncbi:hypothetical protein BC833DRAFT_569829 [Globomyces pollinis-pini]|nr:hypothetical protein BC833DRAFT_569829 [Globomyces pollinis-pini]
MYNLKKLECYPPSLNNYNPQLGLIANEQNHYLILNRRSAVACVSLPIINSQQELIFQLQLSNYKMHRCAVPQKLKTNWREESHWKWSVFWSSDWNEFALMSGHVFMLRWGAKTCVFYLEV